MPFSEFVLQEVPFDDLAGWSSDDPREILAGFDQIKRHLASQKPYKTGALGLTAAELSQLIDRVTPSDRLSAEAARQFFQRETVAFQIKPAGGASGFVTGFYEPAIEVSSNRDDIYKYPIYRRPPDLIDVKQDYASIGIDPSYAYLRSNDGAISYYPDRREIDQGYLEGKALEIAFAKSKTDVFFTHIQGAARLIFPDGAVKRITFDGKAGHPFTAIGKILIERGEISRSEVSMQSIRDWLNDNADQADEVMWLNRSYIFFKEAPVEDLQAGPIAAAKVPLIAGRSLAVDKAIHTFGYPFFICANELRHLDEGQAFSRLMLALDTGSAIIGPARGDIFTGSGFEAGEQAGTIKHQADFYLLIPNLAAERYRQ